MRIILVFLSVVFTVVLAVSTFAQAPVQQGTGSKIGWIDTGAFGDEKAGITKYVNAYKALANEVQPRQAEMAAIQTRIQSIADDIKRMQANPTVPVAQNVLAAKQDEGASLQLDLKRKKEDYDALVQKRSSDVLGPIQADIGRAIQEFAKQKGYAAILDIDKLGQAGALLALDSNVNVTKEFITFYNARSAGTAGTATPK